MTNQDFAITAHDFYSSLPVDVLMRIRSSHIDSFHTMNEILGEHMGLIENEEGFFLEVDGEVHWVGDDLEEALNTICEDGLMPW